MIIAEGDFVTALGDITLKEKGGRAVDYPYCDVWRFRDGQMLELRVSANKIDVNREASSAA
ncbi:nuclear transport factor 2 family protein [Nodosilinea sp. PGN35]|uniref:nuclear transport factor 2 family protein n=1 Tax=Nodosilinea sp. PGN35 TaxID=3020489 RepID=UPI00398B9B78